MVDSMPNPKLCKIKKFNPYNMQAPAIAQQKFVITIAIQFLSLNIRITTSFTGEVPFPESSNSTRNAFILSVSRTPKL